MMQSIYVHLDSISNHVLSSSIYFQPAVLTQNEVPKNLLLLKGRSPLSTYDDYTGFYYIKDEKKILEFLEEIQNSATEYNWIDFESLEFLHQLTPQEIADLLYISHANTHLHSPFFYKLQNNFIFLNLGQEFTKVYYRKMDDFYRQLAAQLTNKMSEEMTRLNRRLFFNQEKNAKELPVELMKELVTYFKVGMVFSTERITKEIQKYTIPLYIAEDRYHVMENVYIKDNLFGQLIYHEEQGWTLDIFKRKSDIL